MPRCSWKALAALPRAWGLMAAVPWWLPLTLTSVPATAQDAPVSTIVAEPPSVYADDRLTSRDTHTEAPNIVRMVRSPTAQSLRGRAIFGRPSELSIEGQALRLAPGARIRDEQNMLVLSGQLVGRSATINYTLDTYGLVKDVWLLRADELSKPWPRTREEASTWRFDPLQQTWIKP